MNAILPYDNQASIIQSEKISFWHWAVFLFLLPFDLFYSQLVLISLAFHMLFHLRREKFRSLLHPLIWMPAMYYVVSLITLLFSPDREDGWNIAGRQLMILLMPLLFCLDGLDMKKHRTRLLLAFSISSTFSILYLYIDAATILWHYRLPVSELFSQQFMNHNFSAPIGIHATYLSLFAALSFVFNLERFLLAKRTRWFYLLSMAVLAGGLLQLSSRAVCISLLLILTLVIPFFLVRPGIKWMSFAAMLIFSGVLIGCISQVESFNIRYIEELKADIGKKNSNIAVPEPRIDRWRATGEIIRKSPVWGFGLGGEKNLLKEKYFEKKMYISYLNEYNAHNQYLSCMLCLGAFGLLIYLFILWKGLVLAWKNIDPLFLTFMILLAVVSLSENILDVNKGIFFYSFFFSFFLYGIGSEGVRQPTSDLKRFIIKKKIV